jgi:hypothetical protein
VSALREDGILCSLIEPSNPCVPDSRKDPTIEILQRCDASIHGTILLVATMGEAYGDVNGISDQLLGTTIIKVTCVGRQWQAQGITKLRSVCPPKAQRKLMSAFEFLSVDCVQLSVAYA